MRKFTKSELAQVGVEIIIVSIPWLKCQKCGQDWSPNIQSGGKMSPRYWHCPNGCNTKKQ